MVALTKERNTRRRDHARNSDPVGAGVKILAGALVVLDAAGNAAPGSTSLGLIARGVATETVDNSAGAAGDIAVTTMVGVFRFENEGSDPVGRADIGATCYIVDDQTVAKTDGVNTRSPAGRIVDVDGAGVWVEIV